MASLNNTSLGGVQKNFAIAKSNLSVILNPSTNQIGAGLVYPIANDGSRQTYTSWSIDALQTASVDNGHGLTIPVMPIHKNFMIDKSGFMRATANTFVPDTHTFTGVQLTGTPNVSQTYRLTVNSWTNYRNYDPTDVRVPVHSSVLQPAAAPFTIAQTVAYLYKNFAYPDRFSNGGTMLSPYADIAVMTNAQWTTLNTAINTFKTTPTLANYTALLTAWGVILLASQTFLAAWAAANFTTAYVTTNNPNLTTIVVKGKFVADRFQLAGSEYFNNINNTLLPNYYAPLAANAATNGLEGNFGVGTATSARMQHEGTSNLAWNNEFYPYFKGNITDQYAEIHIKSNQPQEGVIGEAGGASRQMIDTVIFVQLNGSVTYYLDNGVGAAVTGTINSIATFNTFLAAVTSEFPEFIFT